MPNLDIRELIYDPDLAGVSFQVMRASRVVNQSGRTVETKMTMPAVGAVYPSSPQELRQLPDLERVTEAITVVSQFPFVPLTQSNSPDIVMWNGNDYRVMTCNDYRHYGAGMVQAVCQLIDLTLNDTLLTQMGNGGITIDQDGNGECF